MLKSIIHNPESKINLKSKCQTPKYKFCHLAFVIWVSFGICAFSFVISAMGCATIIEGAKGFMGISTRSLESARKDAIVRTFNYDYFSCYTKILDILKRMHAYVYTQDIKKHMIAIYVSKQDTTTVGIFFKEIGANNTQVEVSSLSTYAKEFISGKIFSVLDNKITLEELEAQINAKEAKESEESKQID